MYRWHSERELMLRRWKQEIALHELSNIDSIPKEFPPVACEDECHCYRGMGFLRKKKPLDCGNPRCGVCHGYGGCWDGGKRQREVKEALGHEWRAEGGW